MTEKKRYVVELDTHILASNDYMTRKIAHKIADAIKDGYNVDVKEIGYQPTGTMYYKKLNDISKPSDKSKDEPLPF